MYLANSIELKYVYTYQYSFIIYNIDTKNWKIKTSFDVTKAVDKLKESLKCPDPQNCENEYGKEFHLSFPKDIKADFQITNVSNKQIMYGHSLRNETSKPNGNF